MTATKAPYSDGWTEELQEPPRWLSLLSTADKRLFVERAGQVTILPAGTRFRPMFSIYSRIGFAVMAPRPAAWVIPSIVTKDGVTIQATVTATLRISDTESAICRVALYPAEQLRIAKDLIVSNVLAAFVGRDYSEVHGNLVSVLDAAEISFRASEPAKSCAFQLISLVCHQIETYDREVAATALERVRILCRAGLDETRVIAERKNQNVVAETQIEAANHEKSLKEIQAATEAIVAAARAEQGHAAQILDVKLKERLAVLAASTEHGMTIIFPNEQFKYNLEKIKLQTQTQKQYESHLSELYTIAAKGAYVDGQIRSIKDVLRDQHNITISEYTNPTQRASISGAAGPEGSYSAPASGDAEPDPSPPAPENGIGP